jgi:RNA-directed DNA polymerase
VGIEIQLLRLMNLPVFNSITELARLIHVDEESVIKYSEEYRRGYYSFEIPKANGKSRRIDAPSRELKAIQAWILRNILDKLTPSPYSTAFTPRKNLLSNVLPHQNNRYFVCLDLHNFFWFVSSNRIARMFELVGYDEDAAWTLSKLCTYYDRLPQGGVTSPALSNLAAAKLDRRIAGFTSRRNITYTRYADDITLSSNNPKILCKALPKILSIIRNEHFSPNLEKLRVLGPRKQCAITGLIKNSSQPRFGVGRRKKRQVRAMMHHLISGKPVVGPYQTEESVKGWLSFVKGVDKNSFDQMQRYWSRLERKYHEN